MIQARKQLLNKVRIYIVIGVVGVIIGLTSLYILVPQLQQIPDKYFSWQLQEQSLEKILKKRHLLESIQLDETKHYLANAEVALPQEKNINSILVAIENLSQQSQLNVRSVSFNPGLVSTSSADLDQTDEEATESASPVSEQQRASQAKSDLFRKGAYALPISVSAIGTHDQFRDFLYRINQSRRFFDIEEMSINFGGKGTPVLQVNLSLFAYFLPPIKEIGGVEGELPEITAADKDMLARLSQMEDVSSVLLQPIIISPDQVGKEDLFGF